MELPETIKVFELDYPVLEIPDHEKRQGYAGDILFFQKEIRIDRTMHITQQLRTLWHELWHAAEAAFGRRDDQTTSDVLADQVALLVNSTLLGNPEIVRLYAELLKKEV